MTRAGRRQARIVALRPAADEVLYIPTVICAERMTSSSSPESRSLTRKRSPTTTFETADRRGRGGFH
jgi:hypothetical protein